MGMKVQLDHATFKQLCLAMAEKIREYDPDEIVAVMRGGMSAAHIISKALDIPCGVYFPSPHPNRLNLRDPDHKKIVFVEDLIAKGRTLLSLMDDMGKNQCKEWKFAPVLIEHDYSKILFNERHFDPRILTYGMITQHWMVMPYEQDEKMVEGDHGLFRDGSDQYGKKLQ